MSKLQSHVRNAAPSSKLKNPGRDRGHYNGAGLAQNTKPLSSSKHAQVTAELRRRIESGISEPGQRLPSFAEMRAEFGVSPATIDRIYAVLEQEGLVVREQGRGIFVAHPEEKVRTGIVGFLGPADMKLRQLPYWAHLLEGIQEKAHQAGFEVLLLNPGVAPSWEKMDGVLAHGDSVDGVLGNRPAIMPAVAVMSDSTLVPSVLADDAAGTAEAVRHLLMLGHRRVACLMMTQTPLPRRRLTGYYAALKEFGIKPVAKWVRPISFPNHQLSLRALGKWNMAHWLHDGWAQTGCTAILVQNDQMALGVLDALRESGIKVPQQVSVIGFDGTEEGQESSPRLTSVQVPLHQIGVQAIQLLLDQIQGEVLHERTWQTPVSVLPTRLEIRETTAPPS